MGRFGTRASLSDFGFYHGFSPVAFSVFLLPCTMVHTTHPSVRPCPLKSPWSLRKFACDPIFLQISVEKKRVHLVYT